MPRIRGTVQGGSTVVVATIHLRPVLVKTTKLTTPYIVIDLSQEKARIDGKPVVVADKLKVVTGCSTIETARAARKRHPRAVVLARQGNTYLPVT